MGKFDLDLYLRAINVLGEREYVEDPIFWIEYMFPWVYERPFNEKEAHRLWTAITALRLKCPSISNITTLLEYLDSLMLKF